MKFNIQRFSDTVSATQNLKYEFGFEDGDTRTFNLPNPRTELVANDIATLNTWIAENQPIIGDKSGSSTTGINSAIIVDQTKTQFDLS